MTRLRARRMRAEDSAVNPMDGLGNLADAMLVLAVGIMLALILNWKVDITAVGRVEEPEDAPVAIDGSDINDAEKQEIDEEILRRVGELFYDEETGTYYAILGEQP